MPRDRFAGRREYLFRIDYSAGHSRDLYIEINGQAAKKINLYCTSGWGAFTTWENCDGAEIAVQLCKGKNKIRLYNEKDSAPHILGVRIMSYD